MPQIWMTYVELARLLHCSPEEAREQAIAVQADRKKSRDGLSRVKLNAAWMELFIGYVRGVDRFERAAHELRSLPHMQAPVLQPMQQPVLQPVQQPSGEDEVKAA
jgi:hypothetical protein